MVIYLFCTQIQALVYTEIWDKSINALYRERLIKIQKKENKIKVTRKKKKINKV